MVPSLSQLEGIYWDPGLSSRQRLVALGGSLLDMPQLQPQHPRAVLVCLYCCKKIQENRQLVNMEVYGSQFCRIKTQIQVVADGVLGVWFLPLR